MSHGVAANTCLAGAAQGDFLDDLTNPKVGQWPKDLAIRRIAKIVVYTGAIIDSVRITYEMKSGELVTVRHGGDSGVESLHFALAENQKLIAVYGRRLNNDSGYGARNIVQLSFMIATKAPENSHDPAAVSIQTVSAINVTSPNTPFELTWDLAAVTSFTSQPPGTTSSFLQGIAFSKVLGHAGPMSCTD